jgi:transporter family-2 protein
VSVAFALLFGALLPIVLRMNETMARHLGVVAGAWGPHAVGALFGLLLLPIMGRGWTAGIASIPWWAYGGGILGTGMVILANRAVWTLGAASFIAVNVATQLVTGLVMDQLGWGGGGVLPITPARVGGVALLALGATLVVRG